MKLNLVPFEQSDGQGLCGPAALVSMLRHYGMEYTEEGLAVIVRGHPHDGTHPEDIITGLGELGFAVHAKQNGTWEELAGLNAKGIPVLLLWHSDFGAYADGHYSILEDISPDAITVMDPEIGDFREMEKEFFLERWHDTDPRTGEKIKQWYLYVVQPNRG